MFIGEAACVHGFGSLKIKISPSISDVYMFSSIYTHISRVCVSVLLSSFFFLSF